MASPFFWFFRSKNNYIWFVQIISKSLVAGVLSHNRLTLRKLQNVSRG